MSEFLNTELLAVDDGEKSALFETYAKMLAEKNKVMNLTAITDPDGIAVKHFADSLTLLQTDIFAENASVLDVGTGAGFPAIPLLIMRNDLHITCMDALQKRLNFIGEVLQELSLRAELLHGRAEDMGHKERYRESFDVVTARAVANLSVLCEYCLPFVRLGGYFAAMKGPAVKEETENAKKALEILGGEICEIKTFELADGSVRNIVIIKKVKPCPEKYPRNPSKISKAPL